MIYHKFCYHYVFFQLKQALYLHRTFVRLKIISLETLFYRILEFIQSQELLGNKYIRPRENIKPFKIGRFLKERKLRV